MSATVLHPRAMNAETTAALNHSFSGTGRVAVTLTEDDASAYWASAGGIRRATAPGPWVSVTDQATRRAVRIRVASCGLPCVCDAEAEIEKENAS